MSRIFISYSSKDRDFVLRLANDLRQAGHDIWLDVQKITGRKPYWSEIQDGIEACNHFLFVISPDSIIPESGPYIELFHVGGIDLPQRPQIIPVVARPTPYKSFPILVSPGRLQIHDFTKEPYAVMLPRLLRALDHRLPMPAPASQPMSRMQASRAPSRGLSPALILSGLLGCGIIMLMLVAAFLFIILPGLSPQPTDAPTQRPIAGQATITPRKNVTATSTPTAASRPTQVLFAPTSTTVVILNPTTLPISTVAPINTAFGAGIWTFDNANSGTLTLRDSTGKVMDTFSAPSISQTIGTWRALAASPDGKFVLAVDYDSNKLARYDTGKLLWSIEYSLDNAKVTAVDVSRSGAIYGVAGSDIHGSYLIQTDPDSGKIIKQTNAGGVDIVIDNTHSAIWTVGTDVEKYDFNLDQQVKADIGISGGAASIDVAADGSVWTGELVNSGVPTSGNWLMHVSPDGKLVGNVELKTPPLCVRVNPADNNVWVVGGGALYEFDPNGNLLLQKSTVTTSLSVDPQDGTVWAAGNGKLEHYSAAGALLGAMVITNAPQVFLAVTRPGQ